MLGFFALAACAGWAASARGAVAVRITARLLGDGLGEGWGDNREDCAGGGDSFRELGGELDHSYHQL